MGSSFWLGLGFKGTFLSSSGVKGTGMRDEVFLFFPDVGVLPLLGVSDGVGGRRRRRRLAGVTSAGAGAAPSGCTARTMGRIHLLNAGVNNSCPSYASSSAVKGCVCN